MGYKNASDVLPQEILQLVQDYIDGDYLYIPRKKGSELSWGERNGTRKTLKDRNLTIYHLYLNGAAKVELAREYHLSIKSIERIIYTLKE
jgi:Mor family transcriptional regulator